MKMPWAVGVAVCFLLGSAAGGAGAAEGSLPLPANPAQWVNAPPLSSEALAGKGAVLYFYEEQCPRCREKWPSLLATAKKFEGQPVLFIAVNSGNPRAAVEGYLRQNQINWPTIVDPTREFEKAAGVPEISLNNIAQVMVVSPTGRISFGDWNNLEGTAERALEGAKWKVDPQGLPPTLKSAWVAIEFGNYPAAASAVTAGMTNRNEALQAGAKRLYDVIAQEIDTAAASAQEASTAGRKWEAYRTYHQISTRFAGYKLPDEVSAAMKELAADPQVTAELAAFKTLEMARKQLGSSVSSVRKRGADALRKLIADSPDSEAARLAAPLVEGK